MRPNPQETADLVTFTEEILNGKLHFCAVIMKEWGGCKKNYCHEFSVRAGLQLRSSNKHSTLQVSSNQPQTAYYNGCLQ